MHLMKTDHVFAVLVSFWLLVTEIHFQTWERLCVIYDGWIGTGLNVFIGILVYFCPESTLSRQCYHMRLHFWLAHLLGLQQGIYLVMPSVYYAGWPVEIETVMFIKGLVISVLGENPWVQIWPSTRCGMCWELWWLCAGVPNWPKGEVAVRS
jgi:hypothetical protein